VLIRRSPGPLAFQYPSGLTFDDALLIVRRFMSSLANSVAYGFLGFFKIINLVKKTGREQKEWINAALPRIKDHRTLERKSELASTESDLGAYLYERGVGIRRGTDPTSITAQIDGLQLLKHLLCNGSLEVRPADSGEALGRTDPYIGTTSISLVVLPTSSAPKSSFGRN
jgi:hypothetical protein